MFKSLSHERSLEDAIEEGNDINWSFRHFEYKTELLWVLNDYATLI